MNEAQVNRMLDYRRATFGQRFFSGDYRAFEGLMFRSPKGTLFPVKDQYDTMTWVPDEKAE